MKFLKMLGLAIVAALALSAVVASAASASKFQSANYPAKITGSQVGEHVFTIESELKTKCKKATFEGSLSAASETLTITPTYSECTSFGISSTIKFNECTYVFHAGAELSANHFAGTTDVSCPAGKVITITTATCEVQVGAQTGLGSLEYVNEASGKVTVKANVTGIKYNKTKDGFLCPLNGTGTKEDGKYEGETLTEGNNGNIFVG